MPNQPTSIYNALDMALWERLEIAYILCHENGEIERFNAQASSFFLDINIGDTIREVAANSKISNGFQVFAAALDNHEPWLIFEHHSHIYILRVKTLEVATEKRNLLEISRLQSLDNLNYDNVLNSTEFQDKLSHEFNTPLNGILGVASLLEEEFSDNKLLTEYAQIIKSKTNSLGQVFDQFVALLNRDAPRVMANGEIVNISELLITLTLKHPELDGSRFSGSLNLKIHDDALLLKTDSELLKKALSHILTSLLKHQPVNEFSIDLRKSSSLEDKLAVITMISSSELLVQEVDAFMRKNQTDGFQGLEKATSPTSLQPLLSGLMLAWKYFQLLNIKPSLIISPTMGMKVEIRSPYYSELVLSSKK